MVSIQPEVNRVLHAINSHVTSLRTPWLPYSKFESQVMNTDSGDTFPYDLTSLQEFTYDKFLADYIRRATLVEHIEDAGFFYATDKLVLISDDLSELMLSHHLVGDGLGGVVRGSYRETIFLRVYGVQTLVVSSGSVFMSLVPAAPSTRPESAAKNTVPFPRRYRGTTNELLRRYNIALSLPDTTESCESVCRRHGMECSVTGLWLLTTDCDVLQAVVKECATCQQDTESFRAPFLRRSSLNCRIGKRNFLSCISPSLLSTVSICPCV